jgi:tyrosine-protein kinase Etk/Wzc
MQKQNTIIQLLAICVKWRKRIFWQVFFVCLIALLLLLIVPEWYRSNAKIIPPSEEENTSAISTLISQIPIPSSLLGMAGVSNGASMSMAILQSRTIMESTVNRFNLAKRYRAKDIEKATKILRKRSAFDMDEEGTISLSVSEPTSYFHSKTSRLKTKQLVRDVTNYFISQLDSINRNLLNQKARNIRQFYEKRYAENLNTLTTMEDAFRLFQEKHGTIAMPEQTVATIEAAAQVKAEIMSKEIELGVLKQYFGNNNINTIKAQAEADNLKKQYDNLYQENGADKNKLFPAFQKIPTYGLEYARFVRDIKVQVILVELLLHQLEQARLQELKDTPTIQVLDQANLPVKKTKPLRAITLILTFMFSFLLSAILAVAMEKFQDIQSKRNPDYETVNWMIRELKGDLAKLRLRRK